MRGKLVVAVLLLLGVLAGLVSVAWWRYTAGKIEEAKRQQQPADPALAREHFASIQSQVERQVQSGGLTQALVDEIHAFVERHPDFAAGHRLYGQALMLQGAPEGAYEHWRRSLEIDPRQAELALNLGALANDNGNYEQALHYFAHAVSLEPSNTRYLLSLGAMQVKAMQYDEARATLLKALHIDSSLDQAHSTLSDLYKRQNKLDAAMTQIDKAIELAERNGSDRKVHYILAKAQILRSDNKPEQALLLLQGLPPAERVKPQVLDSMAQCWAQQDQPAKAAELFERAAQTRPTDWQLFASAAFWRIKAGDLDAARAHIESVRQINPRAPSLNQLTEMLRQ